MKSVLLRKLKNGIKTLLESTRLTESLLWTLKRHGGIMLPIYDCRNDLKTLHVQDGMKLEVFWKDLPHGRGPALSVFILDQEILKFDCFGPEDGHYHTPCFDPSKTESRLFMPESTIEAQIQRTRFEIMRNLAYYQSRATDKRVRRFVPDLSALEYSLDRACGLMRRYASELPPERGA